MFLWGNLKMITFCCIFEFSLSKELSQKRKLFLQREFIQVKGLVWPIILILFNAQVTAIKDKEIKYKAEVLESSISHNLT